VAHYVQTKYLSNPSQTCTNAGLCSLVGKKPSKTARIALAVGKHMFDDGSRSASCDDCKLMVAEMHSLLTDKAISDEVKMGVEKLCNYLPGVEYQHLCREYVDGYWADILKYIQGFLADPDMVCQELGMCPGRRDRAPLRWPRFGAMPPHLAQFVHHDDSPGCLGCQVPLDLLINFLRLDNTSRMGLVHFAQDTICLILPSDIDLQCTDFLGIYGPPSVLLTLQTINGSMLCQFFKACKKASRSEQFNAMLAQRQQPRQGGFIECETCRHLLQWVGDEMKKASFQDDVVRFLQQVCDRFARQDKCQQMINADQVREVLALLAGELKIGHFCTRMKVCPSS